MSLALSPDLEGKQKRKVQILSGKDNQQFGINRFNIESNKYMVRKIYIPEEVRKNIASHLNDAIDRAVLGFESVFEDEDVVTGYLFGQMKIGPQSVVIDNQEIGGIWKWSIDFKKFGGRGKGAT